MKWTLLFCIMIAFSFLLFGCSYPNVSAPGCHTQRFLRIDDCDGKSVITNMTVNPQIQCFRIHINNCKGGHIEIANNCSEPMFIGHMEIKPSNRNGIYFISPIELFRSMNSSIEPAQVNDFYPKYNPLQNDFLSINGTIGNQTFTISYVKTGPLCS